MWVDWQSFCWSWGCHSQDGVQLAAGLRWKVKKGLLSMSRFSGVLHFPPCVLFFFFFLVDQMAFPHGGQGPRKVDLDLLWAHSKMSQGLSYGIPLVKPSHKVSWIQRERNRPHSSGRRAFLSREEGAVSSHLHRYMHIYLHRSPHAVFMPIFQRKGFQYYFLCLFLGEKTES